MIDKIFPAIETRVEEKRDAQFWLWLLVSSTLLSLTAYIVQQLNLSPFLRVADLMKILLPVFVFTSLIPLRFRGAVYVFSLVGSAFYIFGFTAGAVLLALVLFCFLVVQLPVPVIGRLLLLTGFLVALALFRTSIVKMPRVQMVVPYAAALVMFRSLVWLHESQHHDMKANFWLRLSYFFCLPNLAFLFYPIVDYRNHIQFYYNAPSPVIWQRGLVFIFSGLLQFVLYRLIRNNFNLSLDQIYTPAQLAQLILVNYASLLQFSGALTAGVGFLCLFGYNLPAPFGNFYFAESFFKYWQKVNTYWNEFLLKTTYYPLYFSLRKKSSLATELSLLLVFIATIFLHWYQKFWITGIVHVPLNDVIFWSILGGLIIANSVYNRFAPENKSEKFSLLVSAFKSSWVFAVMALLTWFWTSESIYQNLYLIKKSFTVPYAFLLLLAIFGVLYAVHFLCLAVWNLFLKKSSITDNWLTLLTAGWFLLLFTAVEIQTGRTSFLTTHLAADVKTDYESTVADVDYYESIMKSSSGLWNTVLSANMPLKNLEGIVKSVDNVLGRELIPNKKMRKNGILVHINSLGMRDKEYTVEKPKGVFRVAVLGGSYEMGSGVSDICVYESIVESRLNRLGKRIEILNFSSGGYAAIQYAYLLDTKVRKFEPDAVVVFSHTRDISRYAGFLSRYIENGIDLHYPALKEKIAQAGINQSMSRPEIMSNMRKLVPGLVAWAFDTIAVMCREQHIRPVWIFAPITNYRTDSLTYATEKNLAQQAGFECYSIADAFDGYTVEQLRVSPDDTHPNCLGHELLADKFLPIISIIDSTKNNYGKWKEKK